MNEKMKKVLMPLIIANAVSVCFVNTTVFADEEDAALELEKVTVTASRTAKEISQVTKTVSVITEADIEYYSQRNIRDLVRYEPGVTVAGLGRFGLSGFNIRGIGGDRVLTLVDGAPVADEFSFGPNLSARRNFVDLDSLKAVEIIRGPASSLYGSNAIGGLVTFVTKDPDDYLMTTDKSYYASIKSGFDTADSNFSNTLTYATGNDTWQGMVLVTHRDGEEYETFFDNDNTTGPSRRSANPQDNTDLNLYTKLVFSPSDNHEWKFIAERFEADSETEVLSQAGTVVFGTVKTAVNADDTRDRTRLALQYRWSGDLAWTDEINFNLYHQSSETEQKTTEDRITASQQPQFRTRDSFYEQDNTGFRLNFVKNIDGNIGQQWVYGLDYDNTDAETLRLGRTINTATNEVVPEFSNFPTRDFPNSEYESYGVFVQNELSFMDGRFLLVPSLRYDSFELDPTADEIYLSGNTGSPIPAAYDESELSAKLGTIFSFNDQWSVFAQYAEGFKAPPIDAVNTGFTNFAGGYTTLPNPDLRPESSETLELGFRFKGERHQMQVSAYRNQYDDFIESLAFRGFNPQTGLLEFQARNLDEAEIDGFEIKGTWDMSDLFEGVRLQYAYANSDGEDETTGNPINSIQPESLVAGLGYDSPGGRWGAELIMTLTSRQDDIDDSGIQSSDPEDPPVAPFETPGYSIYDAVGYFHFTDSLHLNWGIFNLTDKQYWRWNDVLLQPATSSQIPRLTQPGRNASITLKYEF